MDLLRGRWLWALTGAAAAVFALSAWTDGDLPARRWWLDAVGIAVNTVPLLLVGRSPVLVALVFAVTYPLWIDPSWRRPGTRWRSGRLPRSGPGSPVSCTT